MTDQPTFIYAAEYRSRDEALDDYVALENLQGRGLGGIIDAAVVYKDRRGKVHVHKNEIPTQFGAWTGLAVGALVAVVFPPVALGSMMVGGAAGGLLGHLARGMSRHDVRHLGELLDTGQAAIVVIGRSRVGEQLEKVLARACKCVERAVDVDARNVRRQLSEISL